MNNPPISDSELLAQTLGYIRTILVHFPDIPGPVRFNMESAEERLMELSQSADRRDYHGYGGNIGLRDHFAGQILTAFFRGLADPEDAHRCPFIAYYWADRMLEARKLDPKAELDKASTPQTDV